MQTPESILQHSGLLLPLREYSMTPSLFNDGLLQLPGLLPPREYSMTPPLPCPSLFRYPQEMTNSLPVSFAAPTFLPSPFNSPESVQDLLPQLISSSASDRSNSMDSIDSIGSNESISPRRIATLQCPELGCKSTFSASKHLRRHMLKHSPHRHKCSVPNCMQTSYRTDIMKQHVKSHKRAIENMVAQVGALDQTDSNVSDVSEGSK
jgi:hypothetical protein